MTLVSLVLALGIAYAVLSNTDVFEIESIEVEGSTRLSDSYLTSTVSVPKGSNLLNVDASGITSSLTANPWVSSARVWRSFPHTLILQIEENSPAAVVEVSTTTEDGTDVSYWLISADGVWMSEVSADSVTEAREIAIAAAEAAAEAEEEEEESSDSSDSTDSDSDSTESSDSDSTESSDSDSTDSDSSDDSSQDDSASDDASGDESADESSDDSSDSSDSDSDSSDSSSDDTDASDDTESSDDTADAETEDAETEDAAEEESVCNDVHFTLSELALIPVITDTSDVTPVAGEQEDDEGILNALAIIEDSEGDFGDQIATITSANGSSTSVILWNGIEISFGEAEDMETKIAVAESLMEQYPDQISYINVRSASMPSWRSVDQ